MTRAFQFHLPQKVPQLCKDNMKNKWMNKKTLIILLCGAENKCFQIKSSSVVVMLTNPDNFGVFWGTHDVSVSPAIWSVSAFLCWKPTFHLPHAEVNLCSCQHFLHVEIWRHAQKTCRCDTLGHKRTRKTQSKYSHKLTKVDTGTDVFDKFPAFVHV